MTGRVIDLWNRTRHLAGPLVVAAALAGCAATPQTRALTQGPAEGLPPRAELDRVPFFAQERYQCGPAALAMLLNDLGLEAEPATLVSEVYVPARQGSLRPEMRAAIRARGLVAYPLTPELRDLLGEIAAGRPVLVMQNLGLSWAPRWHYAVAVGYDLPEREIVLRSGTLRRRTTELANFERTWARADHWAQVAVPPDELPTTAAPLPWLQAVHELETTEQLEAARRGYAAATLRWPNNAPAWIARGNAAFAVGEHAEAAGSFHRAATLEPQSAAAWNNLAHALAETGCGGSALEAARCAVALAPDKPHAADTLRELRSRGLEKGPECAIPRCPALTAERDPA